MPTFFLEEMPKHPLQIFAQGQYKYPLESWLQGSKGYAVEDPGLRDLAANLVGTNSERKTELGWGWISWILRCQEAIFGDCFPDVSMSILIENVWSLGKKHLEQIWRLKRPLALNWPFCFGTWELLLARGVTKSSKAQFLVSMLLH